ncbi:MAG: isoprenylcysteine carboxylmethyltransferase family protein [Anaerolineales bacterium]
MLILLSLTLYGVLHSLMASHTAKNAFRRAFGERAFRWYRLLFSLLGGVLFLPILALLAVLPNRTLYSIPSPWLAVFWMVQLGGLALGAWSLAVTDVWTFIGAKQPFAPPDAPLEKLVISGPYRWVRHPMYTASLLFLWFVPQMTANWLALSLGTTLYFIIGGYFEERKLLAQFGEDYARYRAQTPMLIPFLMRNA